MSLQTTTLENAVGTEQRAYSLSARGDETFVLSAALLITALRNADYEDIEALADGDDSAYGDFVDRIELGNFVYEHTIDTYADIAKLELEERDQGVKDAWEIETDLRAMQGGVA